CFAMCYYFFFFVQAEDGIRVFHVTGVQTCALPIGRMRALRGLPMNYRHAFHAGNHADVLKHFTLARLIALLSRKEAPFAYLDSHAGVGLYDLLGDQASRTDEWREGIGRLWDLPDLPAPMADYLKVIRELNPDGNLRYYPGSPELARRLTRPQD